MSEQNKRMTTQEKNEKNAKMLCTADDQSLADILDKYLGYSTHKSWVNPNEIYHNESNKKMKSDQDRYYKNSLMTDSPICYERCDRYPTDGNWGTKIIANKVFRQNNQIPQLYGKFSKPVEDDFFQKNNIREYSVVIDERTGKQKLRLGPSAFINHNCLPNCEIMSLGEGAILKANRKILKREEITISYGAAYFGENACMCNSCEKNGVGFFQRPAIEERQDDYLIQRRPAKELFECDYCSKKYIYKSWIEGHIQKEHLFQTFPCEICGKSFNRKDNLKRHINSVHRNVGEAKKFNCQHCLAVFYDRSNLRRYINELHTDPEIACQKCDEIFGSKNQLRIHDARVHIDHPSYQCERCKEGFNAAYKLSRHRYKCQASHFD